MLYFLALKLYLALSDYENTCSNSCYPEWLHDGICDFYCMNPECNYDSSLYSDNKFLVFQHSDCFLECKCDEEKLTNGKCDSECNSYECGYDLGDCGHCDSGCFIEDLESANCKKDCSNQTCDYYNSNSCFHCAKGCSNKDLYLETCKLECLTKECLYIAEASCNILTCASECFYSNLGNSICKHKCYNSDCFYDLGDCDCNFGCFDNSGECETNKTYTDPCDTESCGYKDGKCGFCASGCYEKNLADGICQPECNNESCNYDYGDCGCAPGCSYKYDGLTFIQTGSIDSCSVDCLVLDCRFGIDFCTNSSLVKSAVLNFIVYKDKDKRLNLDICISKGCNSDALNSYLEEADSCSENNVCNVKECFYCMGRANKTFENCLRQNFYECLVCESTIINEFCYKDLYDCPNGYEDVAKLSNMFGISHWCLKDAIQYSKSNYKEIYVNSSLGEAEVEQDAVNTFYKALVNVYAAFTKIYLVNKEIDFFIDDSNSVFINDKYDPLNTNIDHYIYELWIIGGYSITEKTNVYWKDNLKISSFSEKLFLKNIKFIGKYMMKNDCDRETCYYCPWVLNLGVYLFDDHHDFIRVSDYLEFYSTNCSNYSSVNVFSFSKVVYIENVIFEDFRYQYNSFIKSSGVLFLNNVEFLKMQASETGSVILLDCINDCNRSSFSYYQGLVYATGVGYNDVEGVATGSFLKSSGFGYVLITNVKFAYNFAFSSLYESSRGYLIYSKNHLGTISIENCEFNTNYLSYLVYIDVSSLKYTEFRKDKGLVLDYSQQHFSMNNITINSIYCSYGMIYYLMETITQNIKITNLLINKSVIGEDGIFKFVFKGILKEKEEVNGEYDFYLNENSQIVYIYMPPRILYLENISIKASVTGANCLYIENYPNLIAKNISIFSINDGDVKNSEIYEIINLFNKNQETSHFRWRAGKNPEIYCNEMVLVIDSLILSIDSLLISNIFCENQTSPIGLSVSKADKINVSKLYIADGITETKFGTALTVVDSNQIYINEIEIQNITNMQESIVWFDNCKEINIESAKISDVISNYFSTFAVTNSENFFLKNFTFSNMSSLKKSGGCLSLLTGILGSSFKIQLGNFTQCISSNAKGGAVYLNSIMRVFLTSFQMQDVTISKSYSDEGSAIFISNDVHFSDIEDSSLVRLLIFDNDCKIGGVISDYHYSGNFIIDGLEMVNNKRGVYVFYSNENLELHILNTKLYAPNSLTSVIYLTSLIYGSSVFLQNMEISNKNKVAIEASNLQLFIDQLTISDAYEGIYLSENVICEAFGLNITKSINTAINLEKSCQLYCINCGFTHNENFIITVGTNSNFSFENSEIYSNKLSFGYLIYISSGIQKESFIINCIIHSNSLISGSLIYLTSSILTLKASSFVNNQGSSTDIHSIYLFNSKLNVYDSKLQFNSVVENGALLYAVAGSIIRAKNSVFEKSLSIIGNIYGSKAWISIDNCVFSGNAGGDIYTTESYLHIMNSNFEKPLITSLNAGSIVLKSNTETIIKDSVFYSISSKLNTNSIAYIYDESSRQLEILDSTFIGSNYYIIAVLLNQVVSVIINNSEFIGFNTADFSALTAISKIKGNSLSISNSIISENKSNKNGGGVYSENYNLLIDNTVVSFNKAQYSGGGIYFSSPNCDNCSFHILGSTKIFNNSCNSDGGAIKWKNFKPYIDESVLIYNNSAQYGENLASVPAKLGLNTYRRLSDSILITISNAPPGKKLTDLIQIFIYDTYGQVVKTENSINANLLVNETENLFVSISGKTTFKAQKGVFNIKDIIISGVPGSHTYLKLKSDEINSKSVRNDEAEYSNSVYLKIEFRNCTKGEQIQASACINCISTKYTLEPSENCLNCPAGATCPGGGIIIVNDGYWRSSLNSDIIYPCDVIDACLKGTETNELGNCSTGYTGVICKSCEIGYSKTANGICTKCPNEKTNSIIFVLLCVGITFLSFVLVKTALNSAYSPKSLHSIYIKILTNYLQLVFIVTQFDLEWPPYVAYFFNVQRSTSAFSDQLFSFDCYLALRTSDDRENLYYTKLCMISALPIAIVSISYLFWFFYSNLVESYRYLKKEVYTTNIVLFFLVYPTIVKIMFSNFSCIKIDKMNSYLNEDTSIECWDLNYKKFSFIVVIPSIIIWALGVPTILLILMSKNKRRLHLDYYRVVFGFLYNGYKHERFYWEIKIMYRKILLITISVFKISQARVAQALNFIFVLLASIYIHNKFKPYYSNELNNMEMQALNIAAITIYFGLYYLSKSIDSSIQILFFIFIIFGNSYFVFYWLYYMGKALIDIFLKFFPRFKSFLKRGDAFDEEFYKEEIVREGVYFNKFEGKEAYTFINVEKKIEDGDFNYKTMGEAYLDIAKRDIEKINRIRV